MPWPIYSTRFIRAGTAAGSYAWTVPAGKRAVVKYASAVNYAGSTAAAAFYVSGIAYWYVEFQAADYARSLLPMVVAYAGEVLSVYLDHSPMYGHVHGFLFDDVAGQEVDEPVHSDDVPSPWTM